MRKNALKIKQKLGKNHFTDNDLKNLVENSETSVSQKILYFCRNLRGTTQYLGHREKN